MTIALAVPRFAHHTPDSKFYTALSRYFQGEVDRASLQAPYTYRPLVPLLASYGPLKNVDINFAIINVLFTIGAYFIFYRYLQLLLPTRAEVNVGLLLLIVSFPTFNYASGVLTDPAGYLFLTAASYLLAKKRFLLFSLVSSFGVLTREALLVIVLAYLIYIVSSSFSESHPNYSLYYLLLAIPPIFICFAVRLYFADLPTFFWYPSMQNFFMNISRPISLATSLATIFPLLLVMSSGCFRENNNFISKITERFSKKDLRLLASLTIAFTCLLLYSVFSAFMSGRFIWPFYVSLIPIAVVSSQNTKLYNNLLSPVANFCFGDGN